METIESRYGCAAAQLLRCLDVDTNEPVSRLRVSEDARFAVELVVATLDGIPSTPASPRTREYAARVLAGAGSTDSANARHSLRPVARKVQNILATSAR